MAASPRGPDDHLIRDVRGRVFAEGLAPQRVVSLVPSVTETLFALGAGATVAGITDYCIFPPDLDRPRVGGTKNPRTEEIHALAPDLVHMNLEENLRKHAETIETFAPVFVSEPKSVEDVGRLVVQLGRLHHRRLAAASMVAELSAARAAMPTRSFRFACAIWKDPWMWCGGDTYVSSLVQCAGGTNVLAGRTRYPQLAVDALLALRPEIVFLPDEPYLFTEEDAQQLRAPRVIGPFPGHLFTWHGVRTIEGLRFLREAL